MKLRKETKRISVLSVAVQSALVAMFALPMTAWAEDSLEDEVAAIRSPTNFIELGVQNVSEQSAKFGEYNGLNDNQTGVLGNFSVKGGNAYAGGNGTYSWGVTGTDLGTDSREVGVTVGNQGHWKLNINYDELTHHITDTYQTPQVGSMGGNTFTLPTDFGTFFPVASATDGMPSYDLNATQLGAFHTEEVATTRKNTSFGAGIHLSPQLSLQFDYNHLDQSGAKLIAAGALGQAVSGGTGTWRAEAVAILMNPTNYETDTFNLGLNWVGEQGHVSAAYYGSLFKDGFDRLSYQNPMLNNLTSTAPAGTFQTTTMSTAPDNQFHQLNLTGGYAISPTTKLAGGLSYGRNTQDDTLLSGMAETPVAFALPSAALDGRVITTHADLKLSNQTTDRFTLSVAFKYNERDNQTSSAEYQYYALNNMTVIDVAANAPYSHRKTELGLAGDFRVDKRQSLHFGYDLEKASRWCNDYAITTSSNCLVDVSNKENILSGKYKFKASQDLNFNAGLSYASRTGSYDHEAVTPLAGLDTLTPEDVNAQNYPGYFAVTYAARQRGQFKAGVNWNASEKLELGLNGRYVADAYPDSILGVKKNQTHGLNLDATYSYSDDATVSAYASWQHSLRDMRIGASGGTPVADNTATTYAGLVAPSNIWTNELEENSNAIGINTKHRLMGGKLDIVGDLSYSLDKSRYATAVPYLLTCSATTTLTCGALPDIRSALTTFKLTGIYTVDKKSKVSLAYLHQKLENEDYFYNWYQYGYTGLRGMPTNQVAPNYTVNVIAASYIYNFK